MPIWTQRQSWMPCLRAGIGQVGLPLQEHHELARCRESPCRYRQVRFALVQLLNRTPQVGERRLASAPAAPARLTQPARGVGTSDSLIAGVYRALSWPSCTSGGSLRPLNSQEGRYASITADVPVSSARELYFVQHHPAVMTRNHRTTRIMHHAHTPTSMLPAAAAFLSCCCCPPYR